MDWLWEGIVASTFVQAVPEILIIAMAALPGAVDRAYIVGSDAGNDE